MKKILILATVMSIIAASSCKKSGFLDTQTTASLNSEVTFADSANTMDFLAGLYLNYDYYLQLAQQHNTEDYSKLTDEAEGRYPALGNFDKVFTQGTFANNYFNHSQQRWTLFYRLIRSANIFLENVDKSPLSAAKKTRVKAEARYARSYYYFQLIKYFGGVPLVGDQVFTTSDEGNFVRATWEECVNYISSELDAIAPNLPLNYTGLDYGRVTRGAALSLKARTLLYAASPLYNGGGTTNDANLKPLLSYPTADANRWEKARLAAKAVMDLNIYSLVVNNTTPWSGSSTGKGYGFYSTFLMRNNSEHIFVSLAAPNRDVERGRIPRSRGGGGFYNLPTQELVDKFPTINGKPISADLVSPTNPTGYNSKNPYVNRDPRLSATVIYNEGLYYLNTVRDLAPVYTYVGAPNDGIVAISSNSATCTGYYDRKFCDDNGAINGGSNVDRAIPIIRYAEILLNYAEATNEMGNTAEAMGIIKQLRARAGITPGTGNNYGLPATPSKDEARELIKNERDIELAFEGHRYWDIRRWKDGAEIDGKFMHGMEIRKVGNNYTYTLKNLRTRYFKEVYYYQPIPLDDVVLNPSLLQNPGYQ